jgi:hypothetical protein
MTTTSTFIEPTKANKARLGNRRGSFRFSMLHSRFNLNPASNTLRRHSGASA